MEKHNYNIVVMGKTGTGKSSFGNYLFGENKFPKGTGKPVTTNGFHPINFNLNGLPVTVFDSWGIEADKVDQWLYELDTELKKRDVTEDPSNWFHTVFYCIQAGGHRIEPCDTKIINRFIQEKYKVTVIFTKSDLASDAELKELKNTLARECVQKVDMIEVCSEDKVMRGGHIVKAFGREDVINNIFFNFWNAISTRLPERCIKVMQNEVVSWRNNQSRLIDKTGYFNVSEVEEEIRKEANRYFADLQKGDILIKEINKTIEMFAVFERQVGKLNLKSTNTNFLKEVKLHERSWWFYFPTNFLNFLISGKGDNKERLHKLVDDLAVTMFNRVSSMMPDVITLINNLEPKVKKRGIKQLSSGN